MEDRVRTVPVRRAGRAGVRPVGRGDLPVSDQNPDAHLRDQTTPDQTAGHGDAPTVPNAPENARHSPAKPDEPPDATPGGFDHPTPVSDRYNAVRDVHAESADGHAITIIVTDADGITRRYTATGYTYVSTPGHRTYTFHTATLTPDPYPDSPKSWRPPPAQTDASHGGSDADARNASVSGVHRSKPDADAGADAGIDSGGDADAGSDRDA